MPASLATSTVHPKKTSAMMQAQGHLSWRVTSETKCSKWGRRDSEADDVGAAEGVGVLSREYRRPEGSGIERSGEEGDSEATRLPTFDELGQGQEGPEVALRHEREHQDLPGIFQGFKSSKSDVMMPYAAHVLQFIEVVFKDKNGDEGVTKAAVAVMGDLADVLGPNVSMLFKDRTFHMEILGQCFRSGDAQLKETATWTQGMLGRVLVS
ncbi:hypothetical protein Taro_022302 [Colocasia esculenta]|uniref:Importin subunit beta-1/Transportin-1-like TPR repeats domain-containing protein n=1 Tax=Colocasia esculenta TaxID=4460 RepID=A0A843V1F5_COLES|nr:hypothetical protein [Colocasia esculenta]